MPGLFDDIPDAKPATKGLFDDLPEAPAQKSTGLFDDVPESKSDPLAEAGSYKTSIIDNGIPGYFGRVARKLGPALGRSTEEFAKLPGKIMGGVMGESPARPSATAPIEEKSPAVGGTPFRYTFAKPAEAPMVNEIFPEEVIPGFEEGAQEAKRTFGASVVRDIAFGGLTASGVGTLPAIAAQVGVPAVMEATGLNEAVQGLGQNVQTGLAGQNPSYNRQKLSEIAGETVANLPTIAALVAGPAAARLRKGTPAAQPGAAEASLTAAEPAAPSVAETIYKKTLGPTPYGEETLGKLNLSNLLDTVLPEAVTSKFRGNLENLKRVNPEAAEAAKQRREILNIAKKDTEALTTQIRETLSEAEQKRVAQLMEGLPARRLQAPEDGPLKIARPEETQNYDQRYAEYKALADADVLTNSPGLRPEARELAAKSIALSRLYEDIGGLDYKTWGNYKPTARELAPLNKLEQDLRMAEPVAEGPLPTFEEGVAKVRAKFQRGKGEGEQGLIEQPDIQIGKVTTYSPEVAKAIVEKFDPQTPLNAQSTRLEAHAEVKRILHRIAKAHPGYIKHMYVDKMAEGLNSLLDVQTKRFSGRAAKADTSGFTQRQDPSLTAGLTRVRTVAEPLTKAVLENAALAASRNVQQAFSGTDFVQKVLPDSPVAKALEAKGWRQMPENKSWGDLAGKYVDPRLWDELHNAASPQLLEKNIQHMTDWLSRNMAVGRLSGNLMNFAGAHIANDMVAGIPLWEAPAVISKGMSAYKSKYATDVKRLSTSTLAGESKALQYMEAELAPVKKLQESLDAKRQPAAAHLTGAVDNTTSMLRGFLKYLVTEQGANTVSPRHMAEFFQIVETVNRNGTYVHLRDKGLSHVQARDKMLKAQVDYSDPSAVVQSMRNYGLGGIGNRFAQFGISQTKNLMDTAFNMNPLIAARVWKYPWMASAWNSKMQEYNGESDEAYKKRKALHKTWEGYPASSFILDMPKNAQGHVQTINFGRMNPMGLATQTLTGLSEALKGNPEGQKQMVGGAVGLALPIAPVINLLNRYDPFYGRDPLPGETTMTSPEGLGRAADYLGSRLLPESLGSFPGGQAQTMRREQNPLNQALRGNRTSPDELLVRNVLGVKTQHFDPKLEASDQASKMKAIRGKSNLKFLMRQDVTLDEAKEIQKRHLRNLRRLGRQTQGE